MLEQKITMTFESKRLKKKIIVFEFITHAKGDMAAASYFLKTRFNEYEDK